MPKMKSVCVDLDGVLVEYDRWRGLEHFGQPVSGAVDFTRKLSEKYEVIIFTCRCNYELNQKAARTYINNKLGVEVSLSGSEVIDVLKSLVKSWLDGHDFKYHDIYVGQGKPPATAYIDDKAVYYWYGDKDHSPKFREVLEGLGC